MSSRLLVLSSQLDPGPGPLEEIRRLIKAGVDWESFIGSSALEGVAPLVYRNLKPFAFLLPPVVVGRLRELYVMNSVRNIGLFRQLAPLLDALRTSGFTTALTKGARLA
ncbi:MAG TPA: nucleotidyltransferase family protein, partial [Candidatus Aminicenantes bacterium]|nr:nucleotidyltransferase family protein [Candidatus Aminicenantes bacterium]